MLKTTFTAFVLPLALLFGPPATAWSNSRKTPDSRGPSGTLQKMIVENGTLTMNLDVDRLNADGSLAAKVQQLRFAVAADSFFSILVFNNSLRGAEQGSMALIPAYSTVPPLLSRSIKQLVLEKLPAGEQFDLAVRDARTGFTFFNVEGQQYNYDANGPLLSIVGGRLLISKELANALGRPADAGASVGKMSVSAVMQPIEVSEIVNGEVKSGVMPPLQLAAGAEAPALATGPDVIVGNVDSVEQPTGAINGNFVGLGVGTTSCNNGTEPVDWFQLPSNDHPVIPQNLYRMSGGPNNNERFEQLGQSWMKHAFFALEDNQCGFGCNTSGCTTGSQLCSGCSDTYVASLNDNQTGIGSRAWVNPFTGNFPSGVDGNGQPVANDHTGHNHTGTSHRVTVAMSDLDPTQNPGATYLAEAQYIAPSEYTWCQSHPDQCNMYNNVSYRKFVVSGGPSNFTFSPADSTVRMKPAVMAWADTGATVGRVEPDPGKDGIWFMGYKVSNPSPGVWHYEYALYNENLDRGIQSFSVPLRAGANLSNIDFHAPPQEPGWPNDGTFNNLGYSNTPWTVNQTVSSITWNCETFAENQNANAIRFGTLYNFRFDADQPPQSTHATIGFFKTGSAITVTIQAPARPFPTPRPRPTPAPRP
jgi:hypothetical protein